MCAIAGIVGVRWNDKTIRNMLDSMAHRGPDGEGIFAKENICLLHRRLAVIDPDGGIQPMQLCIGENVYTIVYNGELYNTHEITNELIRLGHTFITRSDTEAVLRAYVQWGSKCLEKLNGIFAFAVHSSLDSSLFLARDRMGVKPLFYTECNGGMIFASEIKTILCHCDIHAELDANGVAEILLLGPGRTPGSGVFRGISELEPGCCGCYREGRFRHWRYWKLLDREHEESFETTAEHVRYLVVDAIKRQTVSDVPLGTFLSGGLDSSIITSICAKQFEERGEKLDTFSVDYEDNDKYFVPGKFQPNSDNHYIDLMCNAFNTVHHWTVLSPDALLRHLEQSTCARDLPGMADVDFSLHAFCEQIRKHVKVALSGECADEIFGGYPWYRDPEIRTAEGFPWAQNINERASFIAPDFTTQINSVEFVMDRYRHTIDNSDILPGTSRQERRMKEMVNLNITWFMQTLLERKDRMSMHNGLEVRVPFCDYRIAQYMYAVPWEYKDYNGMEKGLLRYAMRGYLPEEVLYRKKSPYPKTWHPAYLTTVSKHLQDTLANKDEPIFQIVNRSALERLITAEYIWPWYGQLMKVPQTIAFMLQINFWLKRYNIRIV